MVALTHFWLMEILAEYPNHLADNMLHKLRNYKKQIPLLPMERSLLVKDLTGKLFLYELIFRHHIGGSVYKKYIENNGLVAEEQLPPNLPKWSKLKNPIFTPTTKSENGHDLPVEPSLFYEDMGIEGRSTASMLLDMYADAYEYAEKKGILILDTKFEASNHCVADEILTPDSSRFVDKNDWEKAVATGKDPKFYDKEVVRDWGKTVETPFGVKGINNLDPENENHVDFVNKLSVPYEILEEAEARYKEIVLRLTGLSLKQYQKDAMGI